MQVRMLLLWCLVWCLCSCQVAAQVPSGLDGGGLYIPGDAWFRDVWAWPDVASKSVKTRDGFRRPPRRRRKKNLWQWTDKPNGPALPQNDVDGRGCGIYFGHSRHAT